MKHILVVEDDSKLRSMLVDYLTQHAFRATAAKDSHQLRQILSSDPADLVIVDLNLGRLSVHVAHLDIGRDLLGGCHDRIASETI